MSQKNRDKIRSKIRGKPRVIKTKKIKKRRKDN
jgi:hypothetical protein